METTVGKLKIGAPLVMGRYSVSKDADPAPIVWLKGTPNSDFITEFGVDYLPFDALERESENARHRYCGNPDYAKSNLLQFLNSDQEEWYCPTHRYDAPPIRSNVNNRYKDTYKEHYGFLYYFEEYELCSILEGTGGKIRLPVYGNFTGGDRFHLFNKKGVRAKATADFVENKSVGFRETSYVPIWLADGNEHNEEAYIMGRNGEVNYQRPVYPCGVRPICVVNPDTIVIRDDNGLYHIKSYGVNPNVCTDEELFEFLGVALP